MFWLTSDLVFSFFFFFFFLLFLVFNWLMKLSHEFSVERKRHCYQGPGWTNIEVYFGGGLAQIGWAMFRGKILVSGQDP